MQSLIFRIISRIKELTGCFRFAFLFETGILEYVIESWVIAVSIRVGNRNITGLNTRTFVILKFDRCTG